MKLTLMKTSSDKRDLSKSTTTIKTVNCKIKEGTSIINPTVIINKMSASHIRQCNYSYISDLGRYYFITDIESVKSELWGVSMKVDVLETYKQQIYNNEAILSRQENLYNLYLKDDYLNFTSDTFTLYKEFPNNNFKNDTFILMTNG